MTGLKWTRRTTAKIAVELSSVGIEISDRTVTSVRKAYKKGVKITRDQMDELDLTNDEALPKWNYTLQPV